MSEDDIDLEHFRERLLALRAELRSAGGNSDSQTVELDQQRQGRLSRMDALSAQQMTLAAERRRADTLRRAEAALRRIDAGDYGLCRHCDEPIGHKRLEFDPTVLYCIDCASKAEQALHRTATSTAGWLPSVAIRPTAGSGRRRGLART